MRLIARMGFHLLNMMRGPVLILLMIARGFFLLSLAAGVVYLIALPGSKRFEVMYLGFSFIGAFICYGMSRVYDRTLLRLNMEATR